MARLPECGRIGVRTAGDSFHRVRPCPHFERLRSRVSPPFSEPDAHAGPPRPRVPRTRLRVPGESFFHPARRKDPEPNFHPRPTIDAPRLATLRLESRPSLAARHRSQTDFRHEASRRRTVKV